MEVFDCQFCDTSLPSRAIFCGSCAKQVRCKACKDILEPDSLICISCGTPVGKDGELLVTEELVRPNQALNLNTLEFDETRKGRSLRARLTDAAVGHLSDSFSLFMAGRMTDGTQSNRRPPSPILEEITAEHDQLPPPATEGVGGYDATRELVVPNQEQTTDKDKLKKVFRYEGEQLRLYESRLKATSKLDAARRLTYLLLYAHELEGRNSIPRDDLNEALKKAALFDGNASFWIGSSPDLHIEANTVSLRLPGQEQARKVLDEVLNPEVPNSWTLGTSKASGSGKSKTQNDGKAKAGSQRKQNGRSTKVDTWLNAWGTAGLSIDGHEVLKDRSVTDKGIFGLYAIRRTVGDNGKIVSRGNLSKFLYEAFELKVNERNLL